MNNKVDRRVVEMAFLNSQFENGIAESIGSLDKLQDALNLKSVGEGFAEAEAGVGRLKSSFNALDAVVFSVINNLTNRLVDFGLGAVHDMLFGNLTKGFAGYEHIMDRTRVIYANAGAMWGRTMDEVSDSIEVLRDYAAVTVYTVEGLVDGLKTMSQARIDLEPATRAIMGLGNAGAYVGASVEGINSALSIYSRFMGRGTQNLIEWDQFYRNMGGGVELVNTIVEAAYAVGDLERSYVDAVKEGRIYFRDLINQNESQGGHAQRLSAETFRYAAELFYANQHMAEAATRIQTITRLFQNMRTVVAKGWIETFQHIIGGAEESARLLTGISDWWISIVKPINNARNEALKFWSANEGRDMILDGLLNTLRMLGTIITAVGKGFQDIFQPITGRDLVELSARFQAFSERLVITDDVLHDIRRTVAGLISVFGIFSQITDAMTSVIANVLLSLFPAVRDIWLITGSIGDFFFVLDYILRSTGVFQAIADIISTALTSVIRVIQGFVSAIVRSVLPPINLVLSFILTNIHFIGELIHAVLWLIANTIGTGVEWIADKLHGGLVLLGDFFSRWDFSLRDWLDRTQARIDGLDDIDMGSTERFAGRMEFLTEPFDRIVERFQWIGAQIARFVDWIRPHVTAAWTIVAGAFAGIWDGIAQAWEERGLEGVLDVLNTAVTTGVLASTFLLINNIRTMVSGASTIMSSISQGFLGFAASMRAFAREKNTQALLNFSLAIGVLTAALIALAFIPADKLQNGLLTIAGLMGALAGVAAVIGAVFGNPKLTLSLISFGGAALLLSSSLVIAAVGLVAFAGALWVLSKIQFETLERGLQIVLILFSMFAIAGMVIGLAKGGGAVIALGAAILALGIGLAVLTAAFASLSLLSEDTINTGLGVTVSLLLALGLFGLMASKAAKPIMALGFGLVGVAMAMGLMVPAFAALDRMDWQTLVAGFGGLVGLMLGMSLLALVMTRNAEALKFSLIKMAGAVMLVAGAIYVFALGVAKLQSLEDMELVLWTFAALIGVFAGLAILAYKLPAIIPGMLMAAGSVALLGAAVLVFASGLLVFQEIEKLNIPAMIAAFLMALAMMISTALVLKHIAPLLLDTAASIAILGVALIAIAAAFLIFDQVKLGGVITGMFAMVGLMGIMYGASKVFAVASPAMIKASLSILILTGALAILLASLVAFSYVVNAENTTAIYTFFGVLVGLIAMIAVFGKALGGLSAIMLGSQISILKFAAAIVIVASSILILAGALFLIGQLDMPGVIAGLVGLAGVLAVVGVAIAAFAAVAVKLKPAMLLLVAGLLKVAGVMKLFAIAAAIFGGAVTLVGLGLLAIASALHSLAEVPFGAIISNTGALINLIGRLAVSARDYRGLERMAMAFGNMGVYAHSMGVGAEYAHRYMSQLLDVVDGAAGRLEEAATKFERAAESMLQSVAALQNGLGIGLEFDNTAAQGVTRLGEGMMGAWNGFWQIRSPSRLMINSGKSIIDGISIGIEDNVSRATKAVTTACNQVAGTFRSELQISSPSRLTHGFGLDTMQGFGNGLLDGLPNVKDILGDLPFAFDDVFGQTAKHATLGGTKIVAEFEVAIEDMNDIFVPVEGEMMSLMDAWVKDAGIGVDLINDEVARISFLDPAHAIFQQRHGRGITEIPAELLKQLEEAEAAWIRRTQGTRLQRGEGGDFTFAGVMGDMGSELAWGAKDIVRGVGAFLGFNRTEAQQWEDLVALRTQVNDLKLQLANDEAEVAEIIEEEYEAIANRTTEQLIQLEIIAMNDRFTRQRLADGNAELEGAVGEAARRAVLEQRILQSLAGVPPDIARRIAADRLESGRYLLDAAGNLTTEEAEAIARREDRELAAHEQRAEDIRNERDRLFDLGMDWEDTLAAATEAVDERRAKRADNSKASAGRASDADRERREMEKRMFEDGRDHILHLRRLQQVTRDEEMLLWEDLGNRFDVDSEHRLASDMQMFDAIIHYRQLNIESMLEEYQVWKGLLDQFEEGTAQRRRIEVEMFDLRAELVGLEATNLRRLRELQRISMEEEVAEWQRIRSLWQNDPAARQRAETEMFDAIVAHRQENVESMRNEYNVWSRLHQQFINDADARKRIENEMHAVRVWALSEREKYEERIAELNEQFEKDMESRTDKIRTTFKLFDEVQEREEVHMVDLIERMRAQRRETELWFASIRELYRRGVPADMLQELIDMGIGSLSYLEAMVDASQGQLQYAINHWYDMGIAASGQAEWEMRHIRKSVDEQVSEMEEAISTLNEMLYEHVDTQEITEQWVENLAEGVTNAQETLLDATGELIEGQIDLLTNQYTADKFEDAGNQNGTSYTAGVIATHYSATTAGEQLAVFAASAAMTPEVIQNFIQAGRDGARGFVTGLLDLLDAAQNAGTRLARAGVMGLTVTLETHSPSRVMSEIGQYGGQGFVNGLLSMLEAAKHAGTELGHSATETMRDAIRQACDLLENQDLDYQPRITPVLDLDEAQYALGRLFDEKQQMQIDEIAAGEARVYAERDHTPATGELATAGMTMHVEMHNVVRSDMDINRINQQLGNLIHRMNRAQGVRQRW